MIISIVQVEGLVNRGPDQGPFDVEDGNDVYINRCSGIAGQWCHIIIVGRVHALCIDESTCALICADDVEDHIFVVNSSKIQLALGGKAPKIMLENCIGVEILVGNQAEEHSIETERSSGVVVSIAKQVASPDPVDPPASMECPPGDFADQHNTRPPRFVRSLSNHLPL